MPEARAIIGGRLIQIGQSFQQLEKSRKHRVAVFRCACGESVVLRVDAVVYGGTKSCGCHRVERAGYLHQVRKPRQRKCHA